LLFMQGALAEPLEDGLSAFQRQNYGAAERLLTPLAEQGNAEAQLTLGLMFTRGLGVERDLDAAIGWFKQAAENPSASQRVRDDATYNRDFITQKQKELAEAESALQAEQARQKQATTSTVEPIILRCLNATVDRPNPSAYYAILTVDLEHMKIKMETSYPGGSGTFDYDIKTANELEISAVAFDDGHARRMLLNRVTGRLDGKIDSKYGWLKNDYDCQPAPKRVF
jgi:Sel1 repeat-containing protein